MRVSRSLRRLVRGPRSACGPPPALLAEPRWNDTHLLFGYRTPAPNAVGQDSGDAVLAPRYASELDRDRGGRMVAFERDLAAAIEVLGLRNDGERPVVGVRDDPRSNVQIRWSKGVRRRHREPQLLAAARRYRGQRNDRGQHQG